MTRVHSNTHLIDPDAVRRRRIELGYTEKRLGVLCGASSAVIRHLESGWPQGDLSVRFVAELCDNLGVTLTDLLSPNPRTGNDTHDDHVDDDAARLGSLLATVDEPVPVEAITEILAWDSPRLDAAAVELHAQLEHSGQVLVDAGDTLTLAADMAAADPDDTKAAVRAAYACRQATLYELRVVYEVATGKYDKREVAGSKRGRHIDRLRTVGVVEPAALSGLAKDAPKLTEAVRFSLMLDEAAEPTGPAPARSDVGGERTSNVPA